MIARAGKYILIEVWDGTSAFDTLLSAVQNEMSFSDESIDITTKGSTGNWKELLEAGGTRSMTFSGNGVHKDEDAEIRMKSIADTQAHTEFRLITGSSEKYEGTFQVTSFQKSGGTSDAEAYSFTLESNGAVDYAQLKDTIADQDETDYDMSGLNGSFVGGDEAGGTAYVVSDTITLSDGTVITVDAIDGNDDVTQFTVTTNSTTSFYFPEVTALTQSSTSGTGTEFVLTVGANNVQNV